jgi:hypothetical protein
MGSLPSTAGVASCPWESIFSGLLLTISSMGSSSNAKGGKDNKYYHYVKLYKIRHKNA